MSETHRERAVFEAPLGITEIFSIDGQTFELVETLAPAARPADPLQMHAVRAVHRDQAGLVLLAEHTGSYMRQIGPATGQRFARELARNVLAGVPLARTNPFALNTLALGLIAAQAEIAALKSQLGDRVRRPAAPEASNGELAAA